MTVKQLFVDARAKDLALDKARKKWYNGNNSRRNISGELRIDLAITELPV